MTLAPETEGATDVFPPFDPTYYTSQLFWLAISFVVLYIALDRFILPKIKTTIEDRRDRIADDLDAAAQAKADAEAAGDAYEKSLADARAKAHGIAADTKAALDKELDAETAEVEAELSAKQDAAEASIRAAKDKAFAEVQGIATATAAAAVEALSGVEIAEADAGKAVDAAMKAKGA